ncbi:hypothetical protein DL768_006913 [Monosporascus sp. mg162]|nr:hypothetical protein DL768_006913 [Monosporascus sp. mg162]
MSSRLTTLASFKTPKVFNEPNQQYARGSPQREGLYSALEAMKQRGPVDIPIVVGGKELHTEKKGRQHNPADHASAVATYSLASESDVQSAIDAALAAKPAWEAMPFADRAAIFLKAADLISNKYRYEIMAATMLGQGKNAWQAEIDAAAELCDFFRFNVAYAEELYAQQPSFHSAGVWNRAEYRPLEGFVYAVSPFNFTAIGGNLAGAPALLGNVVVWKPSDSAVLSNWVVYKILREAGLPEGVIQFVPGDAVEVTRAALAHKQFAALHYTGSTAVFRKLYGEIGAGVAGGRYAGYPRVVGETGGKNFHLVHRSADLDNAAVQTVRGAFEFQGQKCSATSRLYAPRSVWPQLKEKLIAETRALKVGPPTDPANFVGPVIHAASFEKLRRVIDESSKDPEVELLTGGKYDDSKGFYVHPTIFETRNPAHPILNTEFFGPILGVHVYDDMAGGDPEKAFADVCKVVDGTSEYGLTGAVFAADRAAVRFAEEALRDAAGNFYINCKSTGAVVGQQPFGGARASGTNDKAGSVNLLGRFVSVRSIKEEFGATERVAYVSYVHTSLAWVFEKNLYLEFGSDNEGRGHGGNLRREHVRCRKISFCKNDNLDPFTAKFILAAWLASASLMVLMSLTWFSSSYLFSGFRTHPLPAVSLEACAWRILQPHVSLLDVPPIGRSEFLSRQATLANALREAGVDAFVAEPSVSTAYYANVSSSFGLSERPFLVIIDKEGRFSYLVPRFEAGRIAGLEMVYGDGGKRVVEWREEESPYEVLAREMAGLGKVMLDEHARFMIAAGLRGAGIEVVPMSAEVQALRSVKTAAEVAILRAINTFTLELVRSLQRCIRLGVTQEAVVAAGLSLFARAGVGEGFWSIVLFGDQAAYPHGGKFGKTLDAGEFVLIDIGSTLHGYGSDVTRTILPDGASVSEELMNIWRTVHAAQEAGFSHMHANETCADVDAASRVPIEDAGCGVLYTHRLGHGLGLEMHEHPYLNGANKEKLKLGEVATNEPGIYVTTEQAKQVGKAVGFGVRLEDPILVTENGGEPMTGHRARSPYDP